jgi:hypothetical protein
MTAEAVEWPRPGGHAQAGAALARTMDWGVPVQVAWALLAPGDGAAQPTTADPWGVADELRPTPAFAPRSLPWRVQRWQLRHVMAENRARETARRRSRYLAHLDAQVTRCLSCGEWCWQRQPCSACGRERPQLAVVE